MHYFSTILLALLSAFVNISTAAECYYQSGAGNCLTRTGVWDAIENFCEDEWEDCEEFHRYDENDNREGFIGSIGKFPSREACLEAGSNIVDECYGNKNGGSWTFRGSSINISFCPWS